VPTLLLAWIEDPAHPVSSAERLHDLIPGSRLDLARTHADVRRWPGLVAAHVHREQAR